MVASPKNLEDALERRLHRTTREDNRVPDSQRGIDATAATVRGLQVGFVATRIMTAFRLPIMRSLPPLANFWARYVGRGDTDDYPVIGLLLHLLYGTSSGAVFGGLFALLSAERAIEPEQRGNRLGVGVRHGAVGLPDAGRPSQNAS